jgi:1-acyl-sn-glycerol-3-phosphate acyltransferase
MFKKDLRPAKTFRRYHQMARTKIPWLQSLLLLAIAPLVSLCVRFRVRGREHIPQEGGYIVAANHPSIYDPVFIALPVRRHIRFMGKSNLFDTVRGRIVTLLGAFPVRRGVWDKDAFQTAQVLLQKGRVVAIFVEGGVRHPREQALAKSGIGYIASRTKAVVLPIYLETQEVTRLWKFPRLTLTIGKPFQMEYISDPSREQSQAAADCILCKIRQLAK